jgi:hypothetical protein
MLTKIKSEGESKGLNLIITNDELCNYNFVSLWAESENDEEDEIPITQEIIVPIEELYFSVNAMYHMLMERKAQNESSEM